MPLQVFVLPKLDEKLDAELRDSEVVGYHAALNHVESLVNALTVRYLDVLLTLGNEVWNLFQ